VNIHIVNEEEYDSWGWKNIFRLREEVRKFMVIKIGNGEKTSKISIDESKNDELVWRSKKGNEGKCLKFSSIVGIYSYRYLGMEERSAHSENVETSKELWDTLEAKYMVEDASSKKFLVSNFTNYRMTNSRPVLEKYNVLLGILGRFTQHKMNIDESIQVSYIIDKLPPSWKDFKHTLKHLKEELTLIELGSYLLIEESLRVQDSDKLKDTNVDGPLVVNMVEHNNSSEYNDNKGKRKHHDTKANPNKKLKVTCWKCGKPVHLKRIARLVMLATEPMDQAQKY
nr:zinc finger, CCHC-type [Tanacetum cinerariifolium]